MSAFHFPRCSATSRLKMAKIEKAKLDPAFNQDLERLTNQFFLRKLRNKAANAGTASNAKSVSVSTSEQKQEKIAEKYREGAVETQDGTRWKIVGIRTRRDDNLSVDHTVYRIERQMSCGAVERISTQKREFVLRTCTHDTEEEQKQFMNQYNAFMYLHDAYRTRRLSWHLPDVYGIGHTDKFLYGDAHHKNKPKEVVLPRPRPFFVMERLELTLETVLKSGRTKTLSADTCAYLVVGMIKALRLLHNKGIVHRDVQPAHFAIRFPSHGLLNRSEAELTELIVITDLTFSRKYRTGSNQPRSQPRFMGNIKYSSPEAMMYGEQTSVDDLISTFYFLYELSTDELPWVGLQETTKSELIALKQRFEQKTTAMNEEGVETIKQLMELFKYARSLDGFTTCADYSKLTSMILSSTSEKKKHERSLFGFYEPLQRCYDHGFEKKKDTQRKALTPKVRGKASNKKDTSSSESEEAKDAMTQQTCNSYYKKH